MKSLYSLTKYLVIFLLSLSILGVGAIYGAYLYLEPKLPSIDTLKDVRFQVPLRIYSADQKLIAEFGEKRREPLAFEEIPEQMIQAFLAAEDDRFFEHPGVDYQGLVRAAALLLLTGERRQGGSTITMQVARNFFLSSKKTYTRKLNEIFLALKIERLLSKQEILELYLNKIYLGHRAYGVGAASLVYYGRPVDKLETAEIAMIAGLPKAPSRYNPITDPQRALIRRNYVLGRMLKLDFINESKYEQSKSAPITAALHSASSEVEAPYVAEMARAEAVERFGADAYTDGYTIITSLDSRLQQTANLALRRNLHAYDKRHGFRGVIGHYETDESVPQESLLELLAQQPSAAGLTKAIVTRLGEQTAELLLEDAQPLTLDWDGLAWARPHQDQDHLGPEPKTAADILKPGDIIYIYEDTNDKGEHYWRLAQIPQVAGAFIAVSPDDGSIQALVGGYDFYLSKFNRVTQAKRQPGSGFKAFIYSAALEQGYTPASLINDAPVVFEDPALEASWRPENYSGKFFGPTLLRYALTHSRNLVSIRLLREMGIKPTIEYATRFGFDASELPRDLSLALGSGAITPLQMASGYSVLANGGYRVTPYFIRSIHNDQDEVLYQANPDILCPDGEQPIPEAAVPPSDGSPTEITEESQQPRCAPRVITTQNHYLMNSMMRDVIQQGTATAARSLGRRDLAGKTGTTNDQRDAWFNGFNRHLVAITWVGFDDSRPLGRGEVGGRAALPAWIDFMQIALEGMPEELPEMPGGMVTMRIDVDSGQPVGAGHAKAIFEVFREDNAPTPPTNDKGPIAIDSTNEPIAVDPSEDPF
jgi:penicillin-binding protein 1A